MVNLWKSYGQSLRYHQIQLHSSCFPRNSIMSGLTSQTVLFRLDTFPRLDRLFIARQYYGGPIMIIGYLNIEGLSPSKYFACCSLIDAGIFDILVLSETWFPKSFDYLSHPYSFIQSQFVYKHVNSRQSGGLLVLCSIQTRSYISSFQISVHGILLELNGIRFLSMYLPPSMSLHEIQIALDFFPDYHILLGDINVRFHGCPKIHRVLPFKISGIHGYVHTPSLRLLQSSMHLQSPSITWIYSLKVTQIYCQNNSSRQSVISSDYFPTVSWIIRFIQNLFLSNFDC